MRASIALHAVLMTLLTVGPLYDFLDRALTVEDLLLLRGIGLSLLRHVLLGAIFVRLGLSGCLLVAASWNAKVFWLALI